MSLWQAVTWDIARAGGFTAYILLGLSVALGLALSMKWQSPSKWPRIINNELHNFLTLLALIFTTIHVLAVWVDPYTNFGWKEVFIPFLTHYRTIWMSLGIVSLYLGIAIGISAWIRPFIGYAWWRRLHYLTLALYVLVNIHSIMTGSDTNTAWGIGIYGVSIATIGLLLTRRIVLSVKARNEKLAKAAAANAKRQPGTIAGAAQTQQRQPGVMQPQHQPGMAQTQHHQPGTMQPQRQAYTVPNTGKNNTY